MRINKRTILKNKIKFFIDYRRVKKLFVTDKRWHRIDIVILNAEYSYYFKANSLDNGEFKVFVPENLTSS